MRFAHIESAIRVYRQQGLAGIARAVLQKLAAGLGPTSPVLPDTMGASWTEYMSWLTFANAGMLVRGNVDCFDYAIRHLPTAAPMVEIGSFCGLSTNMLTYLKEKHNVKNPLVTCDKWLFEGAADGAMLGDSKTISQAEYRDFVKATFRRNIETFSRFDPPFTMEMLSDEFFTAWQRAEQRRDIFGREFRLGGPISFCYIDGNHSYAFARRDFENCHRFLETGGFVLFDDSADNSGYEVCRVVREVSEAGQYELVAQNPNYFFRKM